MPTRDDLVASSDLECDCKRCRLTAAVTTSENATAVATVTSETQMVDGTCKVGAAATGSARKRQRRTERTCTPSTDKALAQMQRVAPSVMPKGITEIVHYMDHVDPSENYYERQKDSRGECSALRGKLRKFAHSNPSHPATRHWIQTGKWEPPDVESLFALVDLIETMIKVETSNKDELSGTSNSGTMSLNGKAKIPAKPFGKSAETSAHIQCVAPSVMPTSIAEIVRHMDDVDPSENYYDRQKDSRGECSALRGKLRKFARSNPSHPATRHWIQTGKWEPPDAESLFALVDLIETMIRL